MTSGYRAVACAVVALTILPAATVFADQLEDKGYSRGYVAATVWNQSPPAITSSLVGAGGILVKNDTTGKTFEAWCTDIFDWMQAKSNYTLVSGESYFGAARSDELGRLATNHLSSITDSTTSGAFQMAVWELGFETSGNYNIASGTFKTQSTSSAANVTAQNWLTSNLLPNAMSVRVWQSTGTGSNRSQDLVIFAPVPEPGTWAMMAAGLGLMGFCASRRRQ